MSKEKILLRNEHSTKEFGIALADKLKAGDVIALTGELGTGKTTLAKYVAQGLGVSEDVTSPTFTLINEYKSGRLPLYHFDMYRISGEEDARNLGIEDYFYGNGVSIIEWADKIPGMVPKTSMTISMSYGACESERAYEIYKPEAEQI
jgi:tRNA threonylcarbamoyladenosine biosynthesis protein TsaE